MEINIIEAFESFVDQFEDEMSLRLDYSGRAMYGRSCIGIVTDLDPATLMLYLTVFLVDSYEMEGWEVIDLLDGEIRTDSIGLSQIVYFPSLKAEDYN